MPAIAEVTQVHTRLLRLTLAVDASRAFWQLGDPQRPLGAETQMAFEERWFGTVSLARARQLLHYLRDRYCHNVASLAVLRDWRTMDGQTRRLICHWQMQFDDPIYRAFTGELLVSRRLLPASDLTRNFVAKWLDSHFPGRWAGRTLAQYARNLLTAASEAGLVSPRKDPRKLLLPTLPDDALVWLLYFLRDAEFTGTLTDNAYLASAGVDAAALGVRLRRLPEVRWNRIGNVDEFIWQHPSLTAWAGRKQ